MVCRFGMENDDDIEWGPKLEPTHSKQALTPVEVVKPSTSVEAEYLKQSHAPRTDFQPRKAGGRNKQCSR